MPTFDRSVDMNGLSNTEIQFPPVTREHILNCSYDQWFPK